MNGLPLHPMLVHLPLALAALVPLVALAALIAHRFHHRSRSLFVAVFLLQTTLAAGAVAASRTGEAEEDRVEAVVADTVLEAHEEAAEAFVVAAWVAAAASLIPVFWFHRRRIATLGGLVSVIATVVVLGLGIRVGEAGAALVYRHGAANVYVESAGSPSLTGPAHDLSRVHD
ncbi:MAG: hypothetical protein K8J08_08550 [Thermoanaerobaculia bacterium]|nr:hypothetical protein [Thermoanaerobaculia bacterium]